MAGLVPPPPPPPENYIVLGRDGRQHPVRLETLRAWAADGSLTAAHQVFSHATGNWSLAGDLPELRDVFASQGASASRGNQKISGCGCLAIGGAILFILVLMMGGGKKSGSEPSTSPASEPSPSASQIGSGNRASHMNQLVSQLSPLFLSWEETGPASVYVQVSSSAWNNLSRDEQRQLMDDLASKQIVRDIGATIHLRVNSTEVGTIGPGWSGEYKFRRSSE